MVEAVVVDFCPTNGCLWSNSERHANADLYGIKTFQALGGDEKGGAIDVEIAWPPGFTPYQNAAALSRSVSLLFILPLLILYYL